MSAGCGCGGGCGCAAKKEKPAAKSADSGVIKNGKGSAPRNISVKFRKNFDGIKWTAKRGAKPGGKFVKVY